MKNKCLKAFVKAIGASALALSVAGCGSQQLNDYSATTPKLTLDEYFDGPLTAWGMVQDYSDQVTRRFCVELDGNWQGNEGVLAEKFYFTDGEISYRTWKLTKNGSSYTGIAEDVEGTASGATEGFAFQWQYNLQLEIDDTQYVFFLDDWMYQIDQYRVFNRTSMKKFGIEVAHLTIFFDKQQPNRTCKS